MFDPNHNASPFNAIPAVIVILVVAIIGIELVFQAAAFGLVGGPAGIGWRNTAIENYGFFDAVFEWMRLNSSYPPELIMRFMSYVFVHHEAMHAIFAAVLLLAIGKFVAERFSTFAVLAIFFTGAIVGALAYGLLLNDPVQLIGAYPGVYGLMGAFTWSLFVTYEHAGENRLKAFQLIGFLVGLQLLFKLIGGNPSNDWVADLFGFIAGFALSVPLAPGGITRIMSRIRQR